MSRPAYRVLMRAANRLALNYFKRYLGSRFANPYDLKFGLRAFFLPIDCTRTRELPVLIDCSGLLSKRAEKLRILDVGSPQLLSLALGAYSSEWEIVYINQFEQELIDLERKVQTLGLNNVACIRADMTKPETLEQLGRFDYVLSCSVFEHIHPEEGGDAVAANNVPGLINEGGRFVFSVPCYKEKFNEYVEGDVYAVKADGKRTFFQRFYDEASLARQIVEPTGLTLSCRKIIGERFYHEEDIHKRMAFRVGFGKRAYVLGRCFRLLSALFMTVADDYRSLKKPYLAVYALQRR